LILGERHSIEFQQMKRIAILQSNYIPWKGYFDLVASVDEFVLYDDMQFTKNDWRNRNKIKTPSGTQWISVPVGRNIHRRIRDVEIADSTWQKVHWKTLISNYSRARCFDVAANCLEPHYLKDQHDNLSALNRTMILAVLDFLEISTKLSSSSDFELVGDRVERLVNICLQAGASTYVSGPSARKYIDVEVFSKNGITVEWFEYNGYPEYPQLWGTFVHEVSIVDLLFNCGMDAGKFMKWAGK